MTHSFGSRTAFAFIAVAIAAVTMLTGCSDGRSTEAFCETHNAHRDRYLESMEAATAGMDDSALLALLQGGSAIADLTIMWNELADVAPDQIRSDTERVAALWQAQSELADDILSDPLAGLAQALQNAVAMSGPLDRVDTFITENC